MEREQKLTRVRELVKQKVDDNNFEEYESLMKGHLKNEITNRETVYSIDFQPGSSVEAAFSRYYQDDDSACEDYRSKTVRLQFSDQGYQDFLLALSKGHTTVRAGCANVREIDRRYWWHDHEYEWNKDETDTVYNVRVGVRFNFDQGALDLDL